MAGKQKTRQRPLPEMCEAVAVVKGNGNEWHVCVCVWLNHSQDAIDAAIHKCKMCDNGWIEEKNGNPVKILLKEYET